MCQTTNSNCNNKVIYDHMKALNKGNVKQKQNC